MRSTICHVRRFRQLIKISLIPLTCSFIYLYMFYVPVRHTGIEQEHRSVVKTGTRGSTVRNITLRGTLRARRPPSGLIRDTRPKYKRVTSLVDIPTNFNFSHATRDVKFTILWYNPAEWIVSRNKALRIETCEYNNCHVTEDRAWLHNSSVVVFGITMSNLGIQPPVSPTERNRDQIWTFYSLEPPIYHIYSNDYISQSWHNTMNWSMTFNLDSDVFAPYGTFKTRHTVFKRDYDSIYAMKKKMALWVVSNCGSMSRRNDYVSTLQQAGLDVDVYGACGEFGRYAGNLGDLIKQYKFYLSMENSFCKYYVTEKVLERNGDDVITVIRGGADYSQLLPNGTYVDAAMHANVSSLAQYLVSLGSDKDRYIAMMRRKDRYYTLNEDEFGYPYAMCELCRKLNMRNGRRKTYGNLAGEVRREGRCVNPDDIVIK